MNKNIFQEMKKIYKDSGNYLHRMVPLKAISLMSYKLSSKEIKSEFSDLLAMALEDSISNVRFAACRVIEQLIPRVDNDFVQQFRPRLEKLAKEDGDADVVYFANRALQII